MFIEQQISILKWFLKDRVTEDWSNNCCKLSLLRNKLHFKMYSNKTVILNCNNISLYYCFYSIFDQSSLDKNKRLLLYTIQNLTYPTFLKGSIYISIAPHSDDILLLCTSMSMHFGSQLPLLILCFSPLRIPGVSITLMLSRTGLGSWAHTNLRANTNKPESHSRTLQTSYKHMTGTRLHSFRLHSWFEIVLFALFS